MEAQTGAAASAAETPALERVLGRADLVLFTVCAILTIDTLASSAAMGFAWFSWWVITMTVFFIPYGLITAELGAGLAGGGRRLHLGPRGLRTQVGLDGGLDVLDQQRDLDPVGLPDLRGHLRPDVPEDPLAPGRTPAIAIALTWLTVGVGIVRLEVSKWVPNLGAVVKALIFLALGVLGLSALFRGQPPANAFSASSADPEVERQRSPTFRPCSTRRSASSS